MEAARLLADVVAQALSGGCYLDPNLEEVAEEEDSVGFQAAVEDLVVEAEVSEDLAAEVLAAGDRVVAGNLSNTRIRM